MLRHQERHAEWNTKPSFGKRVMVEFEDGIYYPGIINTDGDSPKDIYHAKGRWGVLFDDCTKDRFHDGATDVMVSNQTRPKSISAELRDYYLKQANGRELLEGVEVVPGAGEEHEQSPADTAGSKQKNRGKSSQNSKSLKEPRNKPHEAGGVTLEHATQRVDNSGEAAAAVSGGGGTGGAVAEPVPKKKKKKRKRKQEAVVAGAEGAAPEEGGRSAGKRVSSEWGVDDARSGAGLYRIGKSDKRGKRKKKGTGSGGDRKGGVGGVDGSGGGGSGADGDLPGARADPSASGSTRRSAANKEFHHTHVTEVEEKQEEEGRGAEERPEARGGGSKRMKAGREQRQPPSGVFGSSWGAKSKAVDGDDATSNHGPDAIVPSAPDDSDPNATVVAESGGGGGGRGGGVCDEDDGVEAVWSPPPYNSRQRRWRQEQQQPPQQRLPPTVRRKHKRVVIEEEEEEEETGDGTALCHEDTAAAPLREAASLLPETSTAGAMTRR
ncbi:unnamed protein product [Ectocarpus sp. 4 AP-2014]